VKRQHILLADDHPLALQDYDRCWSSPRNFPITSRHACRPTPCRQGVYCVREINTLATGETAWQPAHC